ncbi:MAG: amidophosphoribosyltransferase [Lachnospiraceae bacterium]|nr:amidophosphoribosyltransferase [Lachnospiraceae bacterium]
MGGFFGVVSKNECKYDLFFGTDYHSHLGTRRGGMAMFGSRGFDRAIHNIQNSPFRTKFERDVQDFDGKIGIGCISDYEPQPLLIQSHLGSYAIATVGKINNTEELVNEAFSNGRTQFLEMSGSNVNPTELVASLVNSRDSIEEGLAYAQSVIDGSMSILIMTEKGLYAARDLYGRTPINIGGKEDGYCVSFESFAYINLGYEDKKELGPGEIVYLTTDGFETLKEPGQIMKICTFLWIYYGYPTSTYEGINVETMRYECGKQLAGRDDVKPDLVAGVPDSGTAHAIGYANASGIAFARPFIKYTPTWPRSFMPTDQSQRNLIARMKLIPVDALIRSRSLLLIDDSIVRGTQMRETTDFLYKSGAKEVHIRPACPPLLYGCRFLNFSRSSSEYDLITRRIIREWEGEEVSDEILSRYSDPDSEKYAAMVDEIRKQLNFTSLKFNRLDDMVKAVGLDKEKLCTYCWDRKGDCSGCKGCGNGSCIQ